MRRIPDHVVALATFVIFLILKYSGTLSVAARTLRGFAAFLARAL